MIGQKKAPGGLPGAHTDLTPRRGGDHVMSYYRISSPPCQTDLSRLLDQANCLAEHHEAIARRHWGLARKHWQIKAALEQLRRGR